jgi:eIF4E-associated protein
LTAMSLETAQVSRTHSSDHACVWLVANIAVVDPDDIILGPPRTSFASSGGLRNASGRSFDADKDGKDGDRLNFRRNGDGESNDRFRDSRGALNFGGRRRDNADQDNEGWSTVKPRKSFGAEGAERFQGRMGGDRIPLDRKPRDRDDQREKPQRGGADAEEAEGRTRNGLLRGKSEPWFKNETVEKPQLTNRERIDRAKSWRDRDNKDADTFDNNHGHDRGDRNDRNDRGDRNNDRNSGRSGQDRRWDRDHRSEREPEWVMEEPSHKAGGHTEEDFKKFMESMKAGKAAAAASDDKSTPLAHLEANIKSQQPAVASAPAADSGPDKFFMAFADKAILNVGSPGAEPADKEPTPKPSKSGGAKSSRFTSFFSPPPHEEMSAPPPHQHQEPPPNPLAALMGGAGAGASQGGDNERQAFQVLLQKLQRSNISTPPAQQPFSQPQQYTPSHEQSPSGPVRSPGGFPQFGPPEPRNDPRIDPRIDPRMDPRIDPRMPHMQDMHAQRPILHHQPVSHQDKLLQDLVERQRHQAAAQGPGRTEANRNTEFLMNLMKSQPEPVRTEQMMIRMHQQRTHSISQMQDREPDFAGPGGRGPQGPMHGQPPPGFLDEPFRRSEPEPRQQPTQILQRPIPPPGLDQMNPNWMPQAGGPIPPQQRNMGIPPGLAGGPGGPGAPGGQAGPGGPVRNHPGMPGMFPPGPNFPPGAAFPPPENMAGPPPRGMQPPPGFFGGPPPPGFMGPPGMGGPGFGGPGPDGPGFPFDGRGMPPPPGAAQAFRRQ